jgi:hypothetical protein
VFVEKNLARTIWEGRQMVEAARIEIYGTKQMMYLARHGGGWRVLGKGPEALGREFGQVVAQQFGRVPDDPHIADFLACVRQHQRPHGDIETCHHRECLEYLANLAYRVHETFIDNTDANQRLKPTYREPYVLA